MLFDLDGTLVDHDGAAAEAVERWVVAAGWVEPDDVGALVTAWHEIAERHFLAYRARETTFQGQRRLRMRDFLPLVGVDAGGWSDDRLDGFFGGYLAAYERAWRRFPDAVPCLATVGCRAQLAVLSNGDQAQQEDKVRRTGLDRHVGVVLTSGLLGVAKPDPEIFTAACRQLGVPPSGAAYVGDRLDVDAEAASTAGLRGIWLDRTSAAGHGVPPTSRVQAVASLTELPAVLERCLHR